jgi:hypothetical protein
VDWYVEGGDVEWRPGATLRVVAAWAYTCGWPPRNKEMAMSSMLSVLPVQPYDIMGSVLTDLMWGCN